MQRLFFITTLIGVAVSMSACGEPYRREASLYVDAAQGALIAKGVCVSPTDCRARELLFWNDGEYFLDVLPKDVTFVNLYMTQDPAVVEAVVVELRKVQERISKPGVVLNVYKSRHLESEDKAQRIVIK